MTEFNRNSTPRRRAKGFLRASTLVETRVKKAAEGRGFSQSRILTHWPEVVGPDIAQIARPVNVSYGRQGLGATLTLLTTGAQAPMLEMQKERIREKVNACYGYAAISRVRITQTAASGFAEGQAQFVPAPKAPRKTVDPARAGEARDMARDVRDPRLREVLESLGGKVLSRKQ